MAEYGVMKPAARQRAAAAVDFCVNRSKRYYNKPFGSKVFVSLVWVLIQKVFVSLVYPKGFRIFLCMSV